MSTPIQTSQSTTETNVAIPTNSNSSPANGNSNSTLPKPKYANTEETTTDPHATQPRPNEANTTPSVPAIVPDVLITFCFTVLFLMYEISTMLTEPSKAISIERSSVSTV